MASTKISISLIKRPESTYNYVILDCPNNDTLLSYIPILLGNPVTDIVRICEVENTYDIEQLTQVGICVHDHMKFDDGGVPPKEVVDDWLDLTEKVFSRQDGTSIGVHCVSGIGRAPVWFPAVEFLSSC